jgi:hypothetical protein
MAEEGGDSYKDALPDELDAAGYVGPYTFPNINRRRIPGAIYLVLAVVCFVVWVTHRNGHVLVNDGFLAAAIVLAVVGAYHFAAGWNLDVSDTDALVAAVGHVGFPVGHASAQQVWRGLRSRPTWRILVYSAEEPPEKRGLVLVDGVDGGVLADYVEENPEDWSGPDYPGSAPPPPA